MRRFASLLILCGLAGCGAPADEPGANEAVELPVPSGPPVVQQVEAEVPDTSRTMQDLHWESAASTEGTALRLIGPGGELLMSLSCASSGAVVAHVPGFSPIGSEDRFSLALGEEPVTLVADPTRQQGAGVTAKGPAPANFADLLAKASRIGALYGTQQIGPHLAPPERQRRAFEEACGG